MSENAEIKIVLSDEGGPDLAGQPTPSVGPSPAPVTPPTPSAPPAQARAATPSPAQAPRAPETTSGTTRAVPSTIDFKAILDAARNAQGVPEIDSHKLEADVLQRVGDAIEKGFKAVLVTDQGRKQVELDKTLTDRIGQTWGTLAMAMSKDVIRFERQAQTQRSAEVRAPQGEFRQPVMLPPGVAMEGIGQGPESAGATQAAQPPTPDPMNLRAEMDAAEEAQRQRRQGEQRAREAREAQRQEDESRRQEEEQLRLEGRLPHYQRKVHAPEEYDPRRGYHDRPEYAAALHGGVGQAREVAAAGDEAGRAGEAAVAAAHAATPEGRAESMLARRREEMDLRREQVEVERRYQELLEQNPELKPQPEYEANAKRKVEAKLQQIEAERAYQEELRRNPEAAAKIEDARRAQAGGPQSAVGRGLMGAAQMGAFGATGQRAAMIASLFQKGGVAAAGGPAGVATMGIIAVSETVASIARIVSQQAALRGEVESAGAALNPYRQREALRKQEEGGLITQLPLVGGMFKALFEAGNAAARAQDQYRQTLEQTATRLSEFSPALGLAEARKDIREMIGNFRRASILGEDLAKFTDAQSRLQEMQRDIQAKEMLAKVKEQAEDAEWKVAVAKLLEEQGKTAGEIGRYLNDNLTLLEQIRDFSAGGAHGIKALAKLLEGAKDEGGEFDFLGDLMAMPTEPVAPLLAAKVAETVGRTAGDLLRGGVGLGDLVRKAMNLAFGRGG